VCFEGAAFYAKLKAVVLEKRIGIAKACPELAYVLFHERTPEGFFHPVHASQASALGALFMPELCGTTARENRIGDTRCGVPFENKPHAAFHPVQIKVPFTRRSEFSSDGCDHEAQTLAECSINLGGAHDRGLDSLEHSRTRLPAADSCPVDKKFLVRFPSFFLFFWDGFSLLFFWEGLHYRPGSAARPPKPHGPGFPFFTKATWWQLSPLSHICHELL
jgi:hypothetical protein